MNPITVILVLAATYSQVQTAPSEPTDDDMHVTVDGTRYELYPAKILEERGIHIPEIPRDENAAYVYFDAINITKPADDELDDALRSATNGVWPEGETGEKLARYVDENTAAIELARKAARMDHYAMPLFRGESDSLFEALLPSCEGHRRLARLLAADAVRHADAGDFTGAIDRLLTAQRMGHQISHGNTVIEGLVGISIGSMAGKRLAQIAETHEIDPALLKNAVAKMNASSKSTLQFEELLRQEANFSRNILNDFFEAPGNVIALTDLSPIDFSSHTRVVDDGWHRLTVALRRLYLPDRAMQRHLDRFYDEINKSIAPHADGTPGTVVDHEKVLSQVPAWDVINANVLPGYDRTYEVVLRHHSDTERSKLRVAIEAYREENGRLPDSLDALVPAYVEAVHADPMTGADFDYSPLRTESTAPHGLEEISYEMMESLRQQRLAPSVLKPRESKWRRYVARYIDTYRLTTSQRNSAEAILRDIESRAADFESKHAATIRQSIERGDDDAARRESRPLDVLFEELTRRLDRLPTAEQRSVGEAAITKNPATDEVADR
ncbi:MAG: hypothetical protein H6819_01495 [Phycisphaerales bacterium]|nr:hypothetical protein [Phycisphaerales bacterium]MCB9857117.1 hypothetical protein [Phycisphaerales bacterium]MCB9861756.1 hypothetical protein [Phycisphaerales bacterium]